jgi:hypothetical protein
VVLDFSGVRSFADAAVGVLVRGLERTRLKVRGVGGHPERMLRYFGLCSQESGERAYYTPEEVRLERTPSA